MIFALPPQGDVDYSMRIYNSDGSEPEMCGNGIRCLARFVAEKDKQGPRQYKVLTGAGTISRLQASLLAHAHIVVWTLPTQEDYISCSTMVVCFPDGMCVVQA